MELEGKAAVVTGGARGLGVSIVEALLTRGVKVCFCDVNDEDGTEKLRILAEKFGEENVLYRNCDVRKDSDIHDLLEVTKSKFKRLDILINNAGIVDEVNWEKMIDVNLGGYVRTTNQAIEYMRKDKGGEGGVILNVASIAGCAPSVMTPLYAASKHAVLGFSRSIAFKSDFSHALLEQVARSSLGNGKVFSLTMLLPDVKSNGIRIVCICPCTIDAPMYHVFREKLTGWRRNLSQNLVKSGLLSVDTVIEGVVKLLLDHDNHGKQLYVSVKDGMGYRNVEEQWTKEFIQLQELFEN